MLEIIKANIVDIEYSLAMALAITSIIYGWNSPIIKKKLSRKPVEVETEEDAENFIRRHFVLSHETGKTRLVLIVGFLAYFVPVKYIFILPIIMFIVIGINEKDRLHWIEVEGNTFIEHIGTKFFTYDIKEVSLTEEKKIKMKDVISDYKLKPNELFMIERWLAN